MTIFLGNPLSGKTTRLVGEFRQQLAAGYQPDQILCLSFFSPNAAAIRHTLRPLAGDFLPWVTTLQRFQTLLLRRHPRQSRLPARAREISPTARGVLLRQAWRATGGPLWQAHGDAPGATAELVRAADWISQNRLRFRVAAGELNQAELARVYAAYIETCDQHRLLTFQEASLRCLELLDDPAVAANVRQSFPVLLLDDAHLARPDQLALIERLRGLATHFTATAWLDDDRPPAAPELRHVAEALHGWGPVAMLPVDQSVAGPPVTPANPVVIEAARRVTGSLGTLEAAYAAPVRLHMAFTVEDEAHAVAQAIVRALVDDETLGPAAVAVIAGDRGLAPFVQRVLGDYGLPVESQPLAARHTPLVRGGLLVLQWALGGASAAIERDLFSLPYLALDAVDAHVLAAEALVLDKPILALTSEELVRLKLQPASPARLEVVRAALAGLAAGPPLDELVEHGLAALGAFAWMQVGAAASGSGFSVEERGRWLEALRGWQRGLRELQAVFALGPLPAVAERLSLAEAVADAITVRGGAGGVRLLEPGQVNGVHARLAFVVGLSESAAPARRAELQLLPEAELPALFADGRPGVLPRARDHAAWIEREARALAELLTRGTEQLWLSTSRYTAAGEAQLPSPFFERLLGAEGEIDRDGNLVVTQPGLWQLIGRAEAAAPAGLLPLLGLGSAGQRADDAGTRLLADHTFSASQVRLYLTCPLQFFYARVLGIETEGGLALDRGSLIHTLLYATLSVGAATLAAGTAGRARLLQRPRPLWMNSVAALRARARAVLEAAWSGTPADLPGGGRYQPDLAWGERFGPELQAQAVHDWAAAILDDWAEYEVAGWPEALQRRPVLLEANFAFELDGYRLTGRLDRVDEIQTPAGPVYEVIDYKTGDTNAGASLAVHLRKFLPDANQPPSDFQLPLYALALMNGVAGLHGTPGALSLLNVEALERKDNGDYKAGACRSVQLAQGGMVDYKNGVVPVDVLTGAITHSIRDTLAHMAASPYPAQPGNHCGYCSFRSACERAQPVAA
jgi:PD-(D/E)XK nuclease superfamily